MAEKKMISKSVEYFDENVIENVEDLLIIGTMAQKEVYDKLHINLRYPQTAISFYACVFDAIRVVLKSYQTNHESFRINIADRLEVGFTSSFDVPELQDVEKKGNFVFYLKHIPNDSLTDPDPDETKSVVLCTQWNATNITSSTEAVKKISVEGLKFLDNRLQLSLGSPELIIPTFCTIHRMMIEYMMLKRRELGEFEYFINMAGCYEVFVREMDDGDNISFKTAIYDKGNMKHDGRATSKYE